MTRNLLFQYSTRLCSVTIFAALAIVGGACGGDSGGAADGSAAGANDTAKYNFETGVQDWSSSDGTITEITTSSTEKAKGAKSLMGTIMATAEKTSPYLVEIVYSGTLPTIMPGSKATFHVLIPTGSSITGFQPYLNEGDASDPQYRFTGTWTVPTPGTWQTVEVVAPVNVTPLIKVGVQFFANAAWTGQVYVDSVDYK